MYMHMRYMYTICMYMLVTTIGDVTTLPRPGRHRPFLPSPLEQPGRRAPVAGRPTYPLFDVAESATYVPK